MKKIMIALLTTALAAGVLAGCGGDNNSSVTSMESDTAASLLSSDTSSLSGLESEAESVVSSEVSCAGKLQRSFFPSFQHGFFQAVFL